jgi:hypothetical protein
MKLSSSILLILYLTLVFLISTFFINYSSFVNGQQLGDPEIIIELDEYEAEIDTSPDVAYPLLEMEGEVSLLSSHPYVSVNLSISNINNPWNCSVEPNQFNLSTYPVDQTIQSIVVFVNAPLGTENETEQRVTVVGSWSYIPEIPGVPNPQPVTGEIQAVHLDVTASNKTTDTPDNGNGGNDKKKDDDDEKGFLPGFEGIFLIVGALLIVVFIQSRKNLQK